MLFKDVLDQLTEMYFPKVGKGTQKEKHYRNRPMGKSKVPKRMIDQSPPTKSDSFNKDKDKIK
jgi:hypothetical protein